MKTSVLSLILISAFVLTPSARAYTGHGNSEAILTFSHAVELQADMVTPTQIQEQVADQVHYMFGPISDQFGPPERSIVGGILGAPRVDDQTRLFKTGILRLGQQFVRSGRKFIAYTYQGPMVLKSGPHTQLRLALPNNPKAIFQASEDLKTRSNALNPCTDPDFQSTGDFFYFWSPDRKGCQLRPSRDVTDPNGQYTIVNASITRQKNQEVSFPEYSKLPDASGNILITLIMGKDTPSRVRSPEKVRGRHDDINAENFRKIAARLDATHEFARRVWTPAEVKALVTRTDLSPQPFVVDYTHMYPQDSKRAKSITVRMVFTNCDIGVANSVGMHRFFENSIEHGAVTIYDGHSGLGGNLDLGSMREASNNSFRFNFPKNRYQIYFFNSCTSYAYYTDLFFDQKVVPGSRDRKGSKFLDIMATGLETAFASSEQTDLALINAVHSWGKTGQEESYQTLAEEMEADNLFGVNGDEDNPKAPAAGGAIAPPPPLAEGETRELEALRPNSGSFAPVPPLELPEFPNSAAEQSAVTGK